MLGGWHIEILLGVQWCGRSDWPPSRDSSGQLAVVAVHTQMPSDGLSLAANQIRAVTAFQPSDREMHAGEPAIVVKEHRVDQRTAGRAYERNRLQRKFL